MHAGSIARAKANHPKLGVVLVADVAATRTTRARCLEWRSGGLFAAATTRASNQLSPS